MVSARARGLAAGTAFVAVLGPALPLLAYDIRFPYPLDLTFYLTAGVVALEVARTVYRNLDVSKPREGYHWPHFAASLGGFLLVLGIVALYPFPETWIRVAALTWVALPLGFVVLSTLYTFASDEGPEWHTPGR